MLLDELQAVEIQHKDIMADLEFGKIKQRALDEYIQRYEDSLVKLNDSQVENEYYAQVQGFR